MVLEALRKKAGEVVDAAKETTVNTAAGAVMSDAEKAIAQKMGITGMNLTYFRKEAEANAGLESVFKKLEKDMATTPQYDTLLAAFGTRFKEEAKRNNVDTDKDTILDLIGRDIKKDPSLGAKLEEAMKKHPNEFAKRIGSYKEGELATVIAEVSAPKVQEPATEVKKSPVGVGAAAAAVTTPASTKAAPAAAPKAPVATATPAAPAPTTATPPQPAANAPASAEVAATAVAKPNDPIDDLIDDLASNDGATLQNIVKNSIDAKAIGGIGGKIAQVAADKYGVSSSDAKGFAERLTTDTALAGRIAKNFQNNPEFVKTLAKMSKDQSQLSEPMKSKAQQEMNKLIANPELLADDKHVKGLQAQIQQAEEFDKKGGFMGMLKNMFGGLMGPLMSAFQDLSIMISGFTGRHKVLTAGSGKGLGLNMMIDLNAIEANRNEAMAAANQSVYDMTALTDRGADGKFFHNGEPILDKSGKQTMKDGKPVYEQVPNGQITLKTADGKDAKLIPSVGQLAAKQMGNGNIQFYAATEVGSNGATSKMEKFEVTPAVFNEYKKIADAKGQAHGGSIQTLTLETFTEAEAIKSGKIPSVQVVSVHSSTGVASPITTVELTGAQNIQQPGLQKSGVETFPVRSANDPDYRLQG